MNDPTTPEGRAELVDTIDRALAMLSAAETVKKTGGAVEIAGVRIEPCDERGETLTLKAFQDAAEARDRVRALIEQAENSPFRGVTFEGAPFPASVDTERLRRALDGDS